MPPLIFLLPLSRAPSQRAWREQRRGKKHWIFRLFDRIRTLFVMMACQETPVSPAAAPRGPKPPQQHGVLVLYKPKGPTSAACIAKVKRLLGQKKIGHAGTLDPMAQGVLPVLLGEGTKLSGHLLEDGEKIYSGVIRLGRITDTWDAEGETLEERDASQVSPAVVAEAMAGLVGTYEQEVPAYSAAKHLGKPLYALARRGLETPVKKKFVTISRGLAELVGPARVFFRVTCSSGTYIRSLAHSLGSRLGCGACLEELTREHSRPFGLEHAHDLEAVLTEPERFAEKVLGIAEVLSDWPKVRATAAQAAGARNGMSVPHASEAGPPFCEGAKALLLDDFGKPLALVLAAQSAGGPVWTVLRGLWHNEP